MPGILTVKEPYHHDVVTNGTPVVPSSTDANLAVVPVGNADGTPLSVAVTSGTDNGVADKSAFTPGTTLEQPVGGIYQTTPDTLTNNQTAAIAIDINRNIKISEATLLAGEDLVNNKMVVEQRNSYATITTATTTTVKSGSGFVHSITIVGGTLGAITVYDNTAGSGTVIISTFTPTATLPCPTLVLDESFGNGLTIVTAAATIINVSYR